MNDQTEVHAPMPRGAVDDPAWNSELMSPQDQERKAEIDRVIDPVESMKQRADTKNLTIGQIKARDEENLRLILATAREHRFETGEQAMDWIAEATERCMHKVGVKSFTKGMFRFQFGRALSAIPGNLYRPGVAPGPVTSECVENDVRLEVRSTDQYQDPQERQEKSGCYIYHGGEIAFFISNPMIDVSRTGGGGHIIIPEKVAQRFFVKTNAPGV